MKLYKTTEAIPLADIIKRLGIFTEYKLNNEISKQDDTKEIREVVERAKNELLQVMNKYGWDYKNNNLIKVERG